MARLSNPAMPREWLTGETAVVGLARSGRAAAQLLARTGAGVYASDNGTSPELEATAADLRRDGVDVQLGGHDLERIARSVVVIASPGVPPNAPPFVVARKAGITIISEVELGLRFLPRLTYISIT